MSRARPNWSASIQRKSTRGTLPRAKLQKSHAALQEFVTATLQSPGPPRLRSPACPKFWKRSLSRFLASPVRTQHNVLLGGDGRGRDPRDACEHRSRRSDQRNEGCLRGLSETVPSWALVLACCSCAALLLKSRIPQWLDPRLNVPG